ncbi:MAG: metal-dependent transcriptional regulator [Armatimonadota bacterium]
MRVSHRAQEILEQYWMEAVEKDADGLRLEQLGEHLDEQALAELSNQGLAVCEDDALTLTEAGTQQARRIIRNHRLAERLLMDVLQARESAVEEAACRFEHCLYDGIDERVCTLLGHPTKCPHGRPIPQGNCCLREAAGPRVVSRLSDMDPGDSGEIAYLATADPDRLKKVMAMGILPGMEVRLVRQYPSYVFDVGNTQYAVDHDLADEVYVRVTGHAK